MLDTEIIKKIERKIDVPFSKMSLKGLKAEPHQPRRGYTVNNDGQVIALRINNTCFVDEELITGLGHLETLIIRFNDIKSFSFLKKLKKLTTLNLSAPYLEDFLYLQELKGLTSLELSSNNISDFLFLRELKCLTSLDLSFNKLSDLSFLQEQKGLTSLDISYNKVSDLSFLRKLKGLTSLNLRNNRISDLSFFVGLKSVTSLDIRHNNLSDFSFLRELKELTSLNLSYNKISDLSFLQELKELTSLNLSFNKISDLSFLQELKGITSLNLRNNKVSDFSFLRKLKGLTLLNLCNNKLSDLSFLQELKGITSLNLRNNNLSDVSFLRELKGLTSLDISYNKISDLSFLRELKGLTSLNISYSKISDLSFLREQKGLTSLNLHNNKTSDLSFLGELKGLTSLDLSDNKISDVSFFGELKGLTSLNLSDNNLSDVSFLGELKGLTSLDLSDNKISDLSFLGELKGLTSLNLSYNKIWDLSFLGKLKGLTSLALSDNNISSLKEILHIPNLFQLRLSKSKIFDLPDRLHNGDLSDIRSFYRGKDKGTDTLYEAKVLFVGEPEAGKTSLMKKLIDPTYKVEPTRPEQSTLGINVHMNWSFDFHNKQQKHFKAHLWDFGGQQIQYYIHQFFLTEEALYILVLDDRKDYPNLDYWFRIIELLGKGSPVLVVRNKKNIDSAAGFDWVKYSNRYKDSLELDYETINLAIPENRFPVIVSKVQDALLKLKHVGEELPASWLRVKEEIINIKDKNHITIDEFKRICKRHGLNNHVDQIATCNYLHKLGILLHFRNDTSLADIVFVNPQWISDAVYMILGDEKIEKYHGRFTKTLLFERWGDNYTNEEKNRMLSLMQKREFDLIYPVESDDCEMFIAPLLLPDVAPEEVNSWDKKGCLSFRYRYKFMPEGIITRLIVRLNDWIAGNNSQKDLVWKSGVILKKDECNALVQKDISKDGLKIIDISIKGKAFEAKDFLAYIRGTVDAVHEQSFKGIDVEPLVPCNCVLCSDNDAPTMFEFSRLKKRKNAGSTTIDCEREPGIREVSILQLWEGIIQESGHPDERLLERVHDREGEPQQFTDRVRGFKTQHNYYGNINIEHKEIEKMSKFHLNIGNGNTFKGDFVVGQEIQNSFNKAKDAEHTSDDLKKLLQDLTKAVVPVAEALDPEQQKQLSSDLNTLIEEATSLNPRRQWWKLSVEGIQEAAKTVGEIGKTAITLLAQVQPLIL